MTWRHARHAFLWLVGLGLLPFLLAAGALRSEVSAHGEAIKTLQDADPIPLGVQLQIDAIQRDASETKKDVRQLREEQRVGLNDLRQEIREALKGRR